MGEALLRDSSAPCAFQTQRRENESVAVLGEVPELPAHLNFKNGKAAPKRKILGGISRGRYSGGRPGLAGAQGNQVSCADILDRKAQTSMTQGGGSQNDFIQENFGLIVCSLEPASPRTSTPNRACKTHLNLEPLLSESKFGVEGGGLQIRIFCSSSSSESASAKRTCFQGGGADSTADPSL